MTKQINPHSTTANNSVASRPMQLASVIPTLEGVYSIQQLADNLEKDPDKIFLFVRNNIKFLPVWGSHKGAFACLMDRCGGAFDQVALASALLSASGIESKVVIGTIRITAQEAGDWLGTNPTKHETSVRCFNKGFISAVPVAGTGPGAAVQIDVAHAWLKIKIAGTWHVFDPAFKPSVKTEGANLHTHMGYDGPAFAEICKPGFDVDSEFIDNVNVSGMNSELSTMASNLRDWITANDASLTDLIGGSSVVELTESSRLSSLWYQTPGSSTVEYNYGNLPDSFKAKLRVQYGKLAGGGFDIDFDLHSQDVAGKRLTLTFDASNHAELRLDGVLLKSTADPIVEDEDEEDTLNATLTVSSDSWDLALVGGTGTYSATWTQRVFVGSHYLIANAWGDGSPELAFYHQKLLTEVRASGAAESDVNVLGESLSVLWFNWNAQKSISADLIGRLTGCSVTLMHQIGFVGFFRNSPGVTELGSPMTDLGGINWSSSAYDFSTTLEADEKEIVANKALSLRGVGFESNTVSQIAAISGVSTDTMMLAANAAHQKLYRADSSNWFDVNGVPGVRSKLIGYSTKDLDHIESEHISNGHTIFIHETDGTQQGNYFGHGYYYQEQRGRTGGIILGAVTGGAIARLNGGQLSDNTDLGTYNENSEVNQTTETTNLTDEKHKVEVDFIVDTQTGFFKYHETDLTVGSEPAPWGMNFTRYYNSRDRNEYSPMGYGWRHNHMITAMEGTNSYSAYGNPSGESSADSVAQLVVIVDMLRQNPFGGYTFVATSLVLGTASTTLTNNVVNVRVGETTYTFTLLSDNVNYAPPIGVPYRLRKNSGPYFVMTSNYDGVEYIFRPDGYIDRIVYPQGVTWTYTYGAGGNVSSVSNGVGAQINFDYGLLSLLDRVWTPNSTVAAYFKVLDQNTISQSIVLPGGVTTAYEYDSKKRMTAYYMPGSIIAGGSRPTSVYNTYDDQDRVIRQVNPASTSTFLYDATFTKVTSNGRTVTTLFDEQKRPRSIIDGTIKTDFRYDAYGRKIQETLPEGNGISYEYDANHRMTKRTLFKKPGSSLANQVETYEYTQLWGTWTRFVNRRGKEWKRGLDLNNGQILWEHGPSGPTAKKVYENLQYGLLTSVTDETGMRTNYSYTAGPSKGYTAMTVSAQPGGLNLSTSRVRDDMGNATSEQDARGNTTAFAYDSQRQLIMRTETAPYSYVTKYEYDLRGNKLEESRETDIPDIWKRNKTSYSESNKVLTTTDPLGNVTKNTYDSLDRLISTEDAEGRVTKYEYNRNHQIVKVIDANGVVADVRTYTDNGKIKTIKDARGNVSTYTYDGFDRKIKLEYPDGSFEAWEYDETGPAYGKTDRVTKVITRTPAGANVITQTFDDYDRLLTRTPTGQPTETYAYDLAGRLLSVSTPPVAGNPARGKFSREYDVAGRLVKEKYQNDPANPTDTKEVGYQLDPNGNITRITYPDGYYVERTFDKLNRLENIKLNGSTTAAASFVYDKLSRRTQMVFANGVTTSYQYDLADRRTGMDVQFGGLPAPALASWRYGFNKVDQMTMQKFPDSSWEWRPPAVSTTEYGAANNLNQILTAGASTLAYADGRGNLTSDGTWTYTYNTENMLIGATNSSVTVSFDYDAENRQIRKTVGSTKTRYVYSGDQLIAEYNDTTGALLRRYVYALGKDDPIMVVDASNVVTYLHADHLGSIIARTNSSGAIVANGKYSYSPFGQSASLTGTTFGFTGQRFDSDLGLYHYKARYYSPTLCRFLQADPAGYDVGYNLYPYAKNDPLNLLDSSGREEENVTFILPKRSSKWKIPENNGVDWRPGSYVTPWKPHDLTLDTQGIIKYAQTTAKQNGLNPMDKGSDAQITQVFQHTLAGAALAKASMNADAIATVFEWGGMGAERLTNGGRLTGASSHDVFEASMGARFYNAGYRGKELTNLMFDYSVKNANANAKFFERNPESSGPLMIIQKKLRF